MKYRYCGYCGCLTNNKEAHSCNCCHQMMLPTETMYDSIYYDALAQAESRKTGKNYTWLDMVQREVKSSLGNGNASNIPRCPVCRSANLKKISATSKVVGAATFGILSKTARSQFVCNSCGYKF